MKSVFLIVILLVFAAASTWSQNGDHAIEPAMISAPRPIFPDEARAHHLAGCGIYQLEIDPKTGGALKVQIIQTAGHPLLNRAAMNGLMLWRARPGGVRVVKLPICFEFKLGQPIVTYGN